MKKHIPNFVTLLNLLSGVLSIYISFTGDLKIAALMIFLAAIFDFLDGLMARLLNAKSDIGLQLDSLADVVSFGVAPAFVLYKTIMLREVLNGRTELEFLAFSAFMIPLFSALRLAKFNVDEDQTTTFTGMPTPAAALYFASFPVMILGCLKDTRNFYYDIVTNPYFLAGSAVVISLLMVSKLPMFSLKIKSVSWNENYTQIIFIVLTVILLITLKFAAIPIIILLYILLSVVNILVK